MHEALNVLGIACVSMLSDTMKLYFETLRTHVIGFSFDSSTDLNRGFVPAYIAALGEILDTDWRDCPADLDLVEQIVLARNRGQHGGNLTSFIVEHDRATLEKHPRPFFIDDDDLWALSEDGSVASLLTPTLKVSEEGLRRAISEVEALAEWIDARLDRAHDWRAAQRR